MALIAVAADKGAPGVTTTALALASVWPNPVLLAECDPAGGDLMFRFPALDGGQLDPRRGLLSLAVAGRRDYQQQQVWPHAQKIHGGLDVLVGVTNAEQGAGLAAMWRPLGAMLAALPGADVIADCGRLGPDGPAYDLLAEAAIVLLVTRPDLGDVIRLRDRAAAIMAAAQRQGRRGIEPGRARHRRPEGTSRPRRPRWRTSCTKPAFRSGWPAGWPMTRRAPSCCAARGVAGSTRRC